jgi:hypothetical protein
MTPRSAALAFRIWQYAEPLGWDCSVKDIAEGLGDVSWQRVRKVLHLKGWSNRVRRDSGAWGDSQGWSVGAGGYDGAFQGPSRSEIVQRLRREAGL